MKRELPIALSNRHIHLTQEDTEILFGEGYQLSVAKELVQPGQYASNEKVDAKGSRGTIKGIRVLGPARSHTQMEVSLGDARVLGVDPVVRESGHLENTPGVTLVGPAGEVELKDGVIIAARHIHMSPEDAANFEVRDQEEVKVKVGGERALVFEKVIVRVSPNYKLEMHVDIEEGNAAGVKNCDMVELIN